MEPQQYSELVANCLTRLGVIPIQGPITGDTSSVILPLLEDAACNGLAEVTFHITSYGGDLDAIAAIQDTCLVLNLNTIGIAVGYASSAAAMLLMSCDHRSATPTSFIMMHWGHLSMGNVDLATIQHRQSPNEYIQRYWDGLIDKILARCRLTREELTDALDHERQFTAQQALECGLIDSVFSRPKPKKSSRSR